MKENNETPEKKNWTKKRIKKTMESTKRKIRTDGETKSHINLFLYVTIDNKLEYQLSYNQLTLQKINIHTINYLYKKYWYPYNQLSAQKSISV